MTPESFPLGCVKTANDFTKRFYFIVSSSFAVILAKPNQRYLLQRGQGVPEKSVEGHCGPACSFQWKKNMKMRLFIS